jgi:hypothetical protein
MSFNSDPAAYVFRVPFIAPALNPFGSSHRIAGGRAG